MQSHGLALTMKAAAKNIEGRHVDQATSAWRERLAQFAQESNRAYLVALRATGISAVAEEAVQESYRKLLERPPADHGYEAGLAYFLRTVRTTAINLTRTTQRQKRREELVMAENENEKRPASSDEQAAASEMAQAARQALEALPQEEREAVSLCCEQGLSHRSAAEVLSVPERTLAYRMQRGLEKLRSTLAAQGFAALTPVAVSEGLRSLGLPPIPQDLGTAVQGMVASSAPQSVRATRRVIASKAAGGAGTGTKLLLGVGLSAALAAGAVLLVSSDKPKPTPALSTAPVAPAAPAVPAVPALPPASAPAVVLPAGLVGWWKLDESNGSTAADSSAAGNPGNVQGGATWTAGKAGGALRLNGSTQYLAMTRSGPAGASAVTAAAWIRTTNSSEQTILSYGTDEGQDLVYFRWLVIGASLQMKARGGRITLAAPGANDGAWHHAAVVIPAAGRLQDTRFYLDGAALAAVTEETAPTAVYNFGSRSPVNVGRDVENNLRYFSGLLDDVRLYQRALLADEIQTLWAEGGGK